MDRRSFLGAGAAAAAGSALGQALPRQAWAAEPEHEWKIVLAWPKNFPGLGTGSARLAERIMAMSGGRIRIKIYGGGELIPPFECFDAVRERKVECAHTTPYYWMNKNRSFAFFSGVPAGLTAIEQNAWILHGGGQELWDESYAEFGVKGILAGNTSVQMFGWFRKEINALEDLNGLKMRIAGLAGEVFNRIGGTAVSLPGSEIMPALQSGVIDAAEWIGPYNDLAFGFHKIADYYYGPGFHEGGSTAEFMLNKALWDDLPNNLQMIVEAACLTENAHLHAEMAAYNIGAMKVLVGKHGVQLRQLPDPVTSQLNRLSLEVLAETADDGDINRRIYESWIAFRAKALAYAPLSEFGFARARAL